MIRSAVQVLCEIGKGDLPVQKLDLMLRLAECPTMEFIEFDEYSFNLDKALIEKAIHIYPQETVPQLVCDYYRSYRDKADQDDNDYYGNEIFSQIISVHR